jgi:hypothetical protein
MRRSLTLLAMISLTACTGQMNSPQGDPGPQGLQGDTSPPGSAGSQGEGNPAGPQAVPGAIGSQGDQDAQGVPGVACPGSVGTVYTIPGSGGIYGGGYLQLQSSNLHFELDVTCSYGSAAENEAFFFADSPLVTTGTIQTTVAIDGRALLAFNDLNYNSGGQDRGFPGQWPWHGVFTANEGGTLTRWDITVTRTAGGDCLAFVYANGGGTGTIFQP